MGDLLIRNVPDYVVQDIDAKAMRLGISRVEYVRRRLAEDARAGAGSVSVADLAQFEDTFGDLADPDVMTAAWG